MLWEEEDFQDSADKLMDRMWQIFLGHYWFRGHNETEAMISNGALTNKNPKSIECDHHTYSTLTNLKQHDDWPIWSF